MEAIQKRVTKIERTAVALGENNVRPLAKRRVAAYARVSTDSDEQFTSFEAQVDYYTRQIAANPDWAMVEVYIWTKALPARIQRSETASTA